MPRGIVGSADYLLPLIKESGLFQCHEDGSVLTRRAQYGGGLIADWRDCKIRTKGRYQVAWKTAKLVYANRLVWYWFNGPIPAGLEVDHIDEDEANDALDNLQLLTPTQNKQKTNASGKIRRPSPDPRIMSEVARRNWENPELRVRMTEAIIERFSDPAVREAAAQSSRAFWNREGVREEMCAKLARGTKAAWQDPIKKEARLAKLRLKRFGPKPEGFL